MIQAARNARLARRVMHDTGRSQPTYDELKALLRLACDALRGVRQIGRPAMVVWQPWPMSAGDVAAYIDARANPETIRMPRRPERVRGVVERVRLAGRETPELFALARAAEDRLAEHSAAVQGLLRSDDHAPVAERLAVQRGATDTWNAYLAALRVAEIRYALVERAHERRRGEREGAGGP